MKNHQKPEKTPQKSTTDRLTGPGWGKLAVFFEFLAYFLAKNWPLTQSKKAQAAPVFYYVF
jgi:hypothetical protein